MASEEPLFDPSLKKRKKKKVVFNEDPLAADADPTTPAPLNEPNPELGPVTEHERLKQNGHMPEVVDEDPPEVQEEKPKEDDDFKAMFGDLKKKKKKKVIPMDLPDDGAPAPKVAEEPTAAPAEDLDFSDLKKKRKKKAALDLEAFEKEMGEVAKKGDDDEGDHPLALDDLDDADLGDDPFARGGETFQAGSEAWLGSDRDYTYPELLHRFYNLLHAVNPSLLNSAGKRYTIAPPSIHREGNKTVFANPAEISKRMRRPAEHVTQYLFSELGTTGSVDNAGRLIIKGRFQQKHFENVLRRYIVEYVTCKTCKSPDTLLTKENRIFFMACESCGSRRSVSAIKSGFQAQVGRRSRTKVG